MKRISYAITLMFVFSPFANATSVSQNPALLADSIVIFVPSKDQELVTPDTELIIEGRIAKVEKGVEPDVIIQPVHSFMRSIQAGIPIRIYLKRFLDRNAYYPIYIVSLSSGEMTTSPPIISIDVVPEYGSKTFNVVISPLLPYSLDATISFPGASLVKGDVYFGVIPPGRDGTFTWVSASGAQNLKGGLTPIKRGIEMTQNSTFNVSNILGQRIQYVFTGTESEGMYLIFALLVVSDTDPYNTQNWIGINMTPLFIRQGDQKE